MTGLPRHDHLVLATEFLPADLRADEERLRERLEGRPIVVFWARGPAQGLSAGLSQWAREQGVVIGVREPRVDRPDGWTTALLAHDLPHLIGLSDRGDRLTRARAPGRVGGRDRRRPARARRARGPAYPCSASLPRGAEWGLPHDGWTRPVECSDADALLDGSLRPSLRLAFPRIAVFHACRRTAPRRGGRASVRAPPAGLPLGAPARRPTPPTAGRSPSVVPTSRAALRPSDKACSERPQARWSASTAPP